MATLIQPSFQKEKKRTPKRVALNVKTYPVYCTIQNMKEKQKNGEGSLGVECNLSVVCCVCFSFSFSIIFFFPLFFLKF